MLIISSYHKKLHFQLEDNSIGIEPNQVINVDEETGKKLLENPWLEEVKEKVPVFERCGVPIGKKSIEEKEPVEKNRRVAKRSKQVNKD